MVPGAFSFLLPCTPEHATPARGISVILDEGQGQAIHLRALGGTTLPTVDERCRMSGRCFLQCSTSPGPAPGWDYAGPAISCLPRLPVPMEVIIDHELRFQPTRGAGGSTQGPRVLAQSRAGPGGGARPVLPPRPGRVVRARLPARQRSGARLPRGLWPSLRAAAAEVGVPITWEAAGDLGPGRATVPLTSSGHAARLPCRGRAGVRGQTPGCGRVAVRVPDWRLRDRGESGWRRSEPRSPILFYKFNGGGGWNSRIPTRIQSVDANGMRRLDEVVRAFPTGRKEVFKVTLEDGKSIKASFRP